MHTIRSSTTPPLVEPELGIWFDGRAPDRAETAAMAAFGITYQHGRYCYGPFRYDFLGDALDYAKRTLAHPAQR